MSHVKKQSNPRFLYRPWRFDSYLMVVRHLIVQEGPKRIVVQRAPYDQFSEEFRRTKPLVYVKRDRLERQVVRQWIDPEFGNDQSCPLGKLYDTEPSALFELRFWVYLLRKLVEDHPASLNLPLAEAVLREWFAEDGPESLHLKKQAARPRPAHLPVEAAHEPLSSQETSMPQEVQTPLLRYTFRGGPFDGRVEEHPGDPDLEDPYFVYGIWRLKGEKRKEFAHLYDRTDEYTATGFRIYDYGGIVSYKYDQFSLRLS